MQLSQRLTLPGASPIPGPLDPATFAGNISLGNIISRAVPFTFAFAGIGLLLMIISSGFTLLTSAGDAKKMEAGKSRLTNAIVGFLIIFAAFWLTQLAGIILGIEEITSVFGR